MQNRRINNRHFGDVGVTVSPALESNSMIVLLSHVRSGDWCSIMPRSVAASFGYEADLRMIPLTEPEPVHAVGLVATHREPFTPLVSALLHEARSLVETGLD